MTGIVASIWRHPIKSHGREALTSVEASVNATLPWDRAWAVAHEGARLSGNEWAPCANFSRCAKAPGLMAIESQLDESTETLTLKHPDRPDLVFRPDSDADKFIEWVKPIMPRDRAQSTGIVRAAVRGMTDSEFPSISLVNSASHAAVEGILEQPLSQKRWRGNIWIDDMPAWDEFNWVGKTVSIGNVELEIHQRITRCLATTANPTTGERDADTLGALKSLGHQDFGVYGVVTKSGTISNGDQVKVQ
jgi:uncharacterized protein YcbX